MARRVVSIDGTEIKPPIIALAKVIEALDRLPDDRARGRVLTWAKDFVSDPAAPMKRRRRPRKLKNLLQQQRDEAATIDASALQAVAPAAEIESTGP